MPPQGPSRALFFDTISVFSVPKRSELRLSVISFREWLQATRRRLS